MLRIRLYERLKISGPLSGSFGCLSGSASDYLSHLENLTLSLNI